MNYSNPAFLWPAPGFPAFLEPQDLHLDAIVAFRHHGHSRALHDWAQEASLRDRIQNARIPLPLEEIAPAKPHEIASKAAQFAALPQAAGINYARVRFRVPLSPSSTRSMRLFDLCARCEVERPRSVAFSPRSGNALNLAFASDLHVAHLWDEIKTAVNRHARDLSETAADPHRLLDAFIDEANALAATGDLDLIVLGGDLVDHVRRHPRGGGRDNVPGNVHLLLAMLDRLQVPTLMIPGNHDHRSFPRRPRSSGLEALGIPRPRARSLLRKSGLWDTLPLSLRDIDALRTRDAEGIPALSDHLALGAPATDYSVSLRGLHLLFASSGCDVLARWREVERERLGLLLRSLRTARHCPDSEGFSEIQLAQITRWLDESRGTALFFHAPLLAPGGNGHMQTPLGPLHLGPQDLLGSRVRFEKRIYQAGFRRGVSFRNPGALIQKLVSAAGPVAAFSGHVHYASALEIDRKTMRIRSVRPGQAVSRPEIVTLLTAPAVGQLNPAVKQPPGYLLARFEDGALVSLQRRTLKVRC